MSYKIPNAEVDKLSKEIIPKLPSYGVRALSDLRAYWIDGFEHAESQIYSPLLESLESALTGIIEQLQIHNNFGHILGMDYEKLQSAKSALEELSKLKQP